MPNIKLYKSSEKEFNFKRLPQFEWITVFYVVLLLGLFPLIYNDYYFDILVFKYHFYCLITVSYIILMTIIGIVYLLKNRDFKIKNLIKPDYFSISELSIVFFLAFTIISTLQSDYKYESFWGNEGRLTGCFLLLLYGISTLLICHTLKLKAWIIDLFLFTGILVCLFGITDYFKLDLLNFKAEILETQYNMFASTIGNINTYTAYVAMVMGISAVLFTSSKSLKKCMLYFICMTISFLAIIMGLSDNAYLALGALFVFLPFWLFKNKTGIKRYILMCTVFIYTIYIVDSVNKAFPDHVLQMSGIFEKISNYSRLEYIVVAASVISISIYFIDFVRKNGNKEYGKKIIILWGVLLAVLSLGILYVLYDINIAGNAQSYGALKNYLVFDDEWGTHRGYIWRIGMESYLKLPLIHKISGNGPDTFGLMVFLERYNEMISKYNEYYDSAHNEYLQYLFTIGPFGLLSYAMILIGSGIHIIKKAGTNPYVIAILFAIIYYSVQAVVNISIPITTPVFFVLIAIGLVGSRTVETEG